MRTSCVGFRGAIGTVLFVVVGCGSSPPTSPSSLTPSASAITADGGVTASADAPQERAGSSVVHDATGDYPPSPYLDVVHAKVTEQGKGTLFFLMVLAGPIPDEPSEPPSLLWVFHVDTDPATSPGGLYNEYIVRVRWDGNEFVGEVIDRTGANPPAPVPFSIDGVTVKLFVPLATLGNASSFGWNAATRPLTSPPSPYLDFAPDGGVQLATWTH